jgi:hypothetical protein
MNGAKNNILAQIDKRRRRRPEDPTHDPHRDLASRVRGGRQDAAIVSHEQAVNEPGPRKSGLMRLAAEGERECGRAYQL